MKHLESRKDIWMENKITLTEREIRIGIYHGVERVIENLLQGKKYNQRYNRYERQFDDSISGSLGELAAAKFLQAYPTAFSYRDAPDVAGYEVRTIKDPTHNLIIKNHEWNKLTRFILIYNKCPEFHICGWFATDDPRLDSCAPVTLSEGRPPVKIVSQEKLNLFGKKNFYDDCIRRDLNDDRSKQRGTL